MLFLVSLFFLALPSSSLSNFPIISTSFGSIRGFEHKNEGGFTAQIFKKLPFAAPPVGDLRWRKPQPPSKWNETIDGTFFGPACAQRTGQYDGPVTGFSEDCLHLNVFTTEDCVKSASCPVLFIIHGGLGLYEASMKFPDETLVNNFVTQGIVVVTTAYRLGAFGNMALGDENALPANLGMHDALAALKFVRAEIHSFGGDKEKITLMGHSTGSQMALLMAFSPGISPPGAPLLFSGVISMSASMGFETQEKQVERSHAVADNLNCTGTAWKIMDCMRSMTTEQVLAAAYDVHGPNIFNEKGLIGVAMAGELMPITNAKELREHAQPVRLMIGTTIYEVPKLLDIPELEFLNEITGAGFGEQNKVNKVIGIENDEECFAKYLEDTESGAFVTTFNTDAQAIVLAAHMFSKLQADGGEEAYLYEYDYPVHARHTDDAYFVLGFHEFEKDENEEWLSRVYPRYFANFVHGKRPAPDFYQLKPNLMNYYSVNKNFTSGVVPHMKFGYQHELVDYYSKMVVYDTRLSTIRLEIANAPVQYH